VKKLLIISFLLLVGSYGFGQSDTLEYKKLPPRNCATPAYTSIVDNRIGQGKAFTIYTYGSGPGNITPNTETIVGQKWNIDFIGIDNCFVSKELKDSIDALNKKTYDLLSKEYGNDWRERYNRDFESTLIRVRNIHKFLEQEELIKNIKSDWTDFIFTSKKENGAYLITVFGFGIWEGKEAIVKFYNLEVDFDKKKVIVLNDELEFLDCR